VPVLLLTMIRRAAKLITCWCEGGSTYMITVPRWARIMFAVILLLLLAAAVTVYRHSQGSARFLALGVLLILAGFLAYGALRGRVPKVVWFLPG
jgi:hypothetical protein